MLLFDLQQTTRSKTVGRQKAIEMQILISSMRKTALTFWEGFLGRLI